MFYFLYLLLITIPFVTNLVLVFVSSGLIIISVDESSSAYENGLRKGDIITDVAQKPVNSVEEVEELVASAKSEGRQSVLLLVRRDGQPRFIVLKFN